MSSDPTTPSSVKYECDCCGACCRQFIVEVSILDILREPKLRECVNPFRFGETFDSEEDDTIPADWSDPFQLGGCLMAGKTKPCPFSINSLCAIYPTRPNECVGFLAGSRKCQQARANEGIRPLQSKGDRI
jgi:Fe-S-cluster containining protein